MNRLVLLLLLAACGGPTPAETPGAETPETQPLAQSSPAAQQTKAEVGPFYHVVYFWLKQPDSPADREKFLKSLKNFIHTSTHIRTRHIGIPAATDRPVIDNSYTFSLILSFDSKEEQDKYQAEPAHLKFIEESEALWEKVLVYDSEELK